MERELLVSVTKKDLKISYFSGHGAGGQHRNKHKNCVRMFHPDSGVTVTGQDQRSLDQNKKMALTRLARHPKFKSWIKLETSRVMQGKQSIEDEINKRVDYLMQPQFLKIEEI